MNRYCPSCGSRLPVRVEGGQGDGVYVYCRDCKAEFPYQACILEGERRIAREAFFAYRRVDRLPIKG